MTRRQKRETDAEGHVVDLRTLWASQGRDNSLIRQAQAEASRLELEQASLVPAGQNSASQPPDSPTRSSDSISEADDICDPEDIPSLQPSRVPTPSSSRTDKAQERSIHDIGAFFAPRRKHLLSKVDSSSCPKTPRQSQGLSFDHSRTGKPRDATIEQEEGQQVQENTSNVDGPSTTPTQPRATKADLVSDTTDTHAQTALREELQPDGAGLQDGDQNSTNKTPKSNRRPTRSTAPGGAKQLVTPSTSPMSTRPDAQPDENADDRAGVPDGQAQVTKTKRRLNLHSGSYNNNNQPPQKRRKTPPKKQAAVQTTLSLSIGGGAGMKECKVCDTVYNPFHPEDVKVHAKRHAVVLKNGGRGVMSSGDR